MNYQRFTMVIITCVAYIKILSTVALNRVLSSKAIFYDAQTFKYTRMTA